MNPEKRRARAKHVKHLHNLEVQYKQRKGRRFILKKLETAVKEVLGDGVNSEGEKDSQKHAEILQPSESKTGVHGDDPGEEVNRG